MALDRVGASFGKAGTRDYISVQLGLEEVKLLGHHESSPAAHGSAPNGNSSRADRGEGSDGCSRPTGPNGATGAKRTTGTTGPTGPSSDAWNDSNYDTGIPIGSSQTTLASVSLPAGSFVVMASTDVQDDLANSAFECDLTDSGGTFQETLLAALEGQSLQAALQGGITLASADTVNLTCSSTGPTSSAGNSIIERSRLGPSTNRSPKSKNGSSALKASRSS